MVPSNPRPTLTSARGPTCFASTHPRRRRRPHPAAISIINPPPPWRYTSCDGRIVFGLGLRLGEAVNRAVDFVFLAAVHPTLEAMGIATTSAKASSRSYTKADAGDPGVSDDLHLVLQGKFSCKECGDECSALSLQGQIGFTN